MNWVSTKDELPIAGKYVLARHNRGTWIDGGDQQNVNCVVVKLVIGITAAEREKMKNGEIEDPIIDAGWSMSTGHTKSKRSNSYRAEDEQSNNLRGYNWRTFGADSFFGQDIICWCYID